jgi:hypothetical protein
MGVLHSPESAFGKELWKWDHSVNERHPSTGEAGKRPVGFQEYPKMLYRAERTDGPPKIVDQMIVRSEDEQRRFESRDFHASQQAAIDAVLAAELVMARAHAERNFSERRMSEKAQAEVSRAEAEAGDMLGEIPEQPRKPRGRPKKSVSLD